MDQFSRSQLVLGKGSAEKLKAARVAVFGIGGVGGYVVEALARGGIGSLDIVDDDLVCVTNINRQIIATVDNIGQSKVDAAEKRILSIDPECRVKKHQMFFLPENADSFDFSEYDYVVDAIDTVKGKLGLIECADAAGVPVISAMGAGNKLDPAAFEVADIYKTSVDPLARVIRRECKKRGIKKLKVVYSKEEVRRAGPEEEDLSEDTGDHGCDERGGAGRYCGNCPAEIRENCGADASATGSVSFVPPVMGLIMAGEVIKDLLEIR